MNIQTNVQSSNPRRAAYVRRTAQRGALLFALALFGYPVVGSIISLMQVDSRTLSIPFRMGVALFSVWMILFSRRARIDGLRKVMLAIWFLYIIRLLHDWLGPNLQGADYALQFFIASAVLPGFALMKAQCFEPRRFALVAFLVASAGALMGLFAGLFGGADVTEGGVSGRLSLSALNPVSLGEQATAAILCGIVLWRDSRSLGRLLLAGTFVLLMTCLVLTGSKGPLLQLLACLGLWAIRRGHVLKLGVFGLPVLAWFVLSSGNPLADRLADAGEDSSTVDRVVMISDSIDQIEGSPIIGSAFVELNSGFYPHNIFVEAGLAFGLPVALVFAGMIAVGMRRAWKTLRTGNDLLGLLFFQGLIDATLAGSIYGMIELWVLLAMLPGPTRRALAVAGPERAPGAAPLSSAVP
jgi:O-antigen ligase